MAIFEHNSETCSYCNDEKIGRELLPPVTPYERHLAAKLFDNWIENPIGNQMVSEADIILNQTKGKLPPINKSVFAWTNGGLFYDARIIDAGEPLEAIGTYRWSPSHLSVLYWQYRPTKPKQLQ